MGGRKSTPTNLKVLRGNPGKRKINKKEPKPESGIPTCPAWLSPRAKTCWKEVAPLLDGMKVLTKADRKALELLCDAYSEWREAREFIRQHGMTYESEKGAASLSIKVDEEGMPESVGAKQSIIHRAYPQVAIAADAWKRIRSILTEFGLTPASRSKVETVGGGEKQSPLQELLGRRKK